MNKKTNHKQASEKIGWQTNGKSHKFKQKARQEQQIEGSGTVVELSDP